MTNDPWTSLRVRQSTNNILDKRKKDFGFKNKEDLIMFLLNLVKTPQEQVQEDLDTLKLHLTSMGCNGVCDQLDDLLKDTLLDPKYIALREKVIEYYKINGRIQKSTFKIFCKELGINENECKTYSEKMNIEWG